MQQNRVELHKRKLHRTLSRSSDMDVKNSKKSVITVERSSDKHEEEVFAAARQQQV